ncbi:MAG: TRAP transporter small permease [Burkholderiaceae bacterium]|jgi:TRAP-type C4-dicarboxylate transport system permease small subunit|nr:TRAP transporter small permease [Burkholderiales bacterium]MCZ8096945.1 TRAP transporter small permease [Burkholderiales bacterium]MCZ8339332.1 TRAP transporter small permease [Burkholderiaceae bacterium]
MDSLLAGWWRLIEGLGRVERALGVLLLTTIVLSITTQVITRYLFGQPLVWVEELAGYCFLWAVFLGASLGAKELRHIRIDTFVARMPLRRQAWWRAATWAIAGACCATIAAQAWDIMDVESRSRTMSLPVDLPRHLFYSTPLFVCVVSMGLTIAYLIVAELALATSGRPVDAQLARLAREREAMAEDAEADAIAERLVAGAHAAEAARPTGGDGPAAGPGPASGERAR